MPRQQETLNKFNLITAEDSYASQTSQNPATSRRVLSLIPNRSGLLTRELGEAKYLPTNLGATGGALFQYDFNDVNGVHQTIRFAATATQLFRETGGVWAAITLYRPDIQQVSSTPFQDYPQFCVINNLCHIGDGFYNWIFDGPNNNNFIEGFPIPLWAPAAVVGSAGNITTQIDKFYWFTFGDPVVGRIHESSSSKISASIGPVTSKQIVISPTPGTISINNGSTAVVGVGTTFVPSMVGLFLFAAGGFVGIIATVTDALHLTIITPYPGTNIVAQPIMIAPQRAQVINIYGSEIDGSKLGQFHGQMGVTQNPPTFTDNSPFVNQANTTILPIDRPIRNDPAPPSKILEVHKSRVFRRVEKTPNQFDFTANEEVAATTNGSPQESVPGADVNTLSDIINVDPFPSPANRIRALKSHADALYIATEKQTTPLYGNSIDDFGLSQVTAISNGIISRWGMESTSHGLVLFTYDRKMLLYPPVSPVWSITPQDINITDQLQEIGLAMQNKFLAIKNSDQDNCRILWYNYGSRNWLVTCFQDNTSIYHTYIYDFDTKGWIELQRGFASVAIFEPTFGQKILVGGAPDGFVYVIDDLQGTFVNATLPAALWRTALIDFGRPDALHIPDYLEFEVDNTALADSTTINFYLDPVNADAPGTPIPMAMEPVPNRPNLFRGFFSAAAAAANEGSPGVLCKRLMVEFNVASDVNAGSFRGVMLKADPVENLFQ